MSFAEQMVQAREALKNAGIKVEVPYSIERFDREALIREELQGNGERESAEFKRKHDLIKDHYRKIMKSDGIVVLNYDKKGIPNYIGGNSFLEIGFAYVNDKKIFLLNPVPEIDFYKTEILAMRPIILDGDLRRIRYRFNDLNH